MPERFARRMLDAFDDDIDLRIKHVQPQPPRVEVHPFIPSKEPVEVWRSGNVVVTAVAVHHEPVPDSVAYRVATPDGAIVVSGDTRVCDEVEQLARGANLLVHEACRTTAMKAAIGGTAFEQIFDYHADTQLLGEMAARSGVPHLVLTHLIPVPRHEKDVASFERDIRNGGYVGCVTVGRDLDSFVIE
jgi:ribonuclease Z